jgi:hypothetical protein
MPTTTRYAIRTRPLSAVGVSLRSRMARPNSSASSPLASFTRLSPSRTSTTRFGSPILLAIEVAAIASVGAITAPRTNPIRQSNPGNRYCAATATPITVKVTRPKARDSMFTMLHENSRHDVTQAAE